MDLRPFLCMFLCLLPIITACGSSNSFPPDKRRIPLGSVSALPPVTNSAWASEAWRYEVAPKEWPAFGRTGNRQQASALNFASKDFQLVWKQRLSAHTFQYRRGTNIWSESPIVVRHKNRWLLIVGAYDHLIHAFDALTGKPLWKFTTGDEVVSTPVFAREGNKSIILAASTDRILYGLDPATGVKRWAVETLPWSYTVSPGVFSSPALFRVGEKTAIAAGYFINNYGRGKSLQQGWAACWYALDGKPLWKVLLTTTQVYGPALVQVKGRPVMIFATADGTVQALDARNGQVAWRYTSDERIRACPTTAMTKTGPIVLVPTSWGIIWALDASTGRPRWSYKADLLAEGSAAVLTLKSGKKAVIYGAYDRCIHALDLETGKRLWRFPTGSYVVASPAVANVAGHPAIFIPSMDSKIYGLDAATGKPFWTGTFGPLPWPFIRRGDAVFSSPIVFEDNGKSYLILPAHDGVLYCWNSH